MPSTRNRKHGEPVERCPLDEERLPRRALKVRTAIRAGYAEVEAHPTTAHGYAPEYHDG